MESVDLTVTFGPAAQDRTTLSKSCRATLETLFRHPIAHNLEWPDVIALFNKIGTVEHKANNETSFSLAGGTQHLLRKRHGKDLATDDVMQLRHMLTDAGWAEPSAHASQNAKVEATPPSDLLIVIDHHEARLYQLDVSAADQADHVIRPYDPHHYLHHLTHKDQTRERGQRATEDPAFYAKIAEAAVPGGRIVIVGHGAGHSNAAHHLVEGLQHHHPAVFQKIACELVADLSSLTPPQLLALGRRALTA